MQLTRLVARGFRNLSPVDLAVPPAGLALVGPNGQGKTNLLEAICYPVLFRSVRGAPDRDVGAHGGPGFLVAADVATRDGPHQVSAQYQRGRTEKVLLLDEAPVERRVEAIGTWLCVAFLPEDTILASGGAAERRSYLDRMLALAQRPYFTALSRYRSAMMQRNAALRQRQPALARAFEAPLAHHGSMVVRQRRAWAAAATDPLRAELALLGEATDVGLRYDAAEELDAPEGWAAALDTVRTRDELRGTTSVGPHRHDLSITLDGRTVRDFGSTGQQRTVAIALRLLELETLRAARDESPALVLDDVFAELDADRQRRLGARLMGAGSTQSFVSAPRREELPPGLDLAIHHVQAGEVRAA